MSGSNDPSKASTSKDVTRGGAQRRVFAPKIPARREKKEATEPAENATKPKREQGRPPRGRGNQRFRQRPEIITERGIFEDGIAGGMERRQGSSSSMPSMKSELGAIKREKIEFGATKSEAKSKAELDFLRDDFISDHKEQEEFDWGPKPLAALAVEAMKQLTIADILQGTEEHGRFLLIHLPDEELPPNGKLKVFESGECRIEGGPVDMIVQALDDCDFHQEAVVLDNNALHVLGNVDPSLFFIPDFSS